MARIRWTDEMVDELASSVAELRTSVTSLHSDVETLRDSVETVRDSVETVRDSVETVRDSVKTLRDNMDGMRVTTQALLQIAAQNQNRMDRFDEEMAMWKRRQEESDERFNVLLAEVRFLIRGDRTDIEGEQSGDR